MPKVILIGSPQTQWNIGNKYLPGGTTVDILESEMKKHKDIVLKVIDQKEDEIVTVNMEDTKKRYTEKELFDMKKAEQVDIIKSMTDDKIPSKEEDRVKLILKLQGK